MRSTAAPRDDERTVAEAGDRFADDPLRAAVGVHLGGVDQRTVTALATGALPFATGEAVHVDGGLHVARL
ncbi:MAG: hypothetical protein O9345_14155 [Burkholderiaceae bacterium]|jgi:hypothetical protein|nr:hypothetical protein [Burkholderiales bacterium]MCZ8339269.1 hypothetical protein [Burkholderiaceae bacterium]